MAPSGAKLSKMDGFTGAQLGYGLATAPLHIWKYYMIIYSIFSVCRVAMKHNNLLESMSHPMPMLQAR